MVYNPRGRVLPHQLLQYLPLTTLTKSSLQRRARASPTLKDTVHAQKKKKKETEVKRLMWAGLRNLSGLMGKCMGITGTLFEHCRIEGKKISTMA